MKLLCALAIVLVCAVTLGAVYYDFEQIAIDATVGGKGLTAAKITPTNGNPQMTYADCRLELAEVRYLIQPPEKLAVTATVGTLLEPGERLTFYKREDMLNFRAIATTGVSGQLNCAYKDLP